MNNQITISNIDNKVLEELKKEADKEGKDLNSFILKILYNKVGKEDEEVQNEELSEIKKLAGTWSDEEYEEFIKNTQGLRQIDMELWQ
ncbi:MAG: hypothetical protein K9I94_11080 [Bacteroidales bacterium]|nr:hypothetical protein [Bacteroidales bacterium]